MKPVVRKSQEGAGALRRSQAGGERGGPGSRNEEGCTSADKVDSSDELFKKKIQDEVKMAILALGL